MAMNHFELKTVNSMPLYAPSKKLRSEKKSIAGFVPFVTAEVLHGGKIFKNKDYRKESTGATTG
jgi:hypothetical protein